MTGRNIMLLGKAPLTVIRLSDGTRKNISSGAAVPASIDPRDAERLVREGFLEEVEVVTVDEVETVEEEIVPFDDGLNPDGTTDTETTYSDEQLDALLAKSEGDLLDEVGDDHVLAAALLEREQGEGGKARKGVSAGLQEVVDNGPSGDQS